MERAGHGVRRQLSAEKTCGVSARPREAFDPAGSNGVGDQREYDARLDALEDAVDVIRRPSIEVDEVHAVGHQAALDRHVAKATPFIPKISMPPSVDSNTK